MPECLPSFLTDVGHKNERASERVLQLSLSLLLSTSFLCWWLNYGRKRTHRKQQQECTQDAIARALPFSLKFPCKFAALASVFLICFFTYFSLPFWKLKMWPSGGITNRLQKLLPRFLSITRCLAGWLALAANSIARIMFVCLPACVCMCSGCIPVIFALLFGTLTAVHLKGSFCLPALGCQSSAYLAIS